jgi:hypothetical protein
VRCVDSDLLSDSDCADYSGEYGQMLLSLLEQERIASQEAAMLKE